jgi:DNA-binding winged helix-turn-helix (wHTH) protein
MKTVRFGEFCFDDDRRVLGREGRDVHLSPKAYQLLKILLARRPAALSKQELNDHLWPATFVADVSLATVVAEVRSALGERGRDGRFIRTVHGFGYAFDGDARDDPSAPDGGAERPQDVPAPGRRSCTIWLEWNGRDYPLSSGDQVVGRVADADIRLDTQSVSRHHARLVRSGCEVAVEDLGSKNGTFVQGRRITSAVAVGDGDTIRFGDVVTVLRNLEVPRATVTVHE